MNKELPAGWTLDQKRCVGDYFALTVPTESYTRRQFVDQDYSKMSIPLIKGPNDLLIIPPPPEDIGKLVEEEITKGVLIMRDYAIAPISPGKLIYHSVSSVGVNSRTHNPTHIVLQNNSNSVSVTLIPTWKPIGNYHLMSPPGGSSTIVYDPTNITHRKKAENKADQETDANAHDEKARAAAVKTAFNRFQSIIDEGKFQIHVFVRDLEDMIFFEEIG